MISVSLYNYYPVKDKGVVDADAVTEHLAEKIRAFLSETRYDIKQGSYLFFTYIGQEYTCRVVEVWVRLDTNLVTYVVELTT